MFENELVQSCLKQQQTGTTNPIQHTAFLQRVARTVKDLMREVIVRSSLVPGSVPSRAAAARQPPRMPRGWRLAAAGPPRAAAARRLGGGRAAAARPPRAAIGGGRTAAGRPWAAH